VEAVRSWLRAIMLRSRMESEMDAELQFHIAAFAEDLVRSGVPCGEALRRARIEFGGIESAKEDPCTRLADGAGLMLKSFLRLRSVNPGFSPHSAMTLTVDLPDSIYRTAPQMEAFHTQALDELSRLPGVIAAGAVNWIPVPTENVIRRERL